jgi:hypothetical protein
MGAHRLELLGCFLGNVLCSFTAFATEGPSVPVFTGIWTVELPMFGCFRVQTVWQLELYLDESLFDPSRNIFLWNIGTE